MSQSASKCAILTYSTEKSPKTNAFTFSLTTYGQVAVTPQQASKLYLLAPKDENINRLPGTTISHFNSVKPTRMSTQRTKNSESLEDMASCVLGLMHSFRERRISYRGRATRTSWFVSLNVVFNYYHWGGDLDSLETFSNDACRMLHSENREMEIIEKLEIRCYFHAFLTRE